MSLISAVRMSKINTEWFLDYEYLDSDYKRWVNISVGGEYRFNQFSFRIGFVYDDMKNELSGNEFLEFKQSFPPIAISISKNLN